MQVCYRVRGIVVSRESSALRVTIVVTLGRQVVEHCGRVGAILLRRPRLLNLKVVVFGVEHSALLAAVFCCLVSEGDGTVVP